ncbi:putative monovalent cation/H+ antiporter subunit E [Brevibacterium mcbrellneri ATCC 49030]|uniref:Putative monovalent cation/H+ antiporter subunit E n=1 Tax=Brevibacterium mcbrellneri ATCC 49030 TaxID=585530 RepID=D4YL65_9MICO|nr:Na+/H+ antiporter subunit E [Brevibacterium mcbrellneri]EFG48159.1 putative monovalent cation/H+ antiporter subunit E [Brevibacterium mcbrellneri ATCC 49030]
MSKARELIRQFLLVVLLVAVWIFLWDTVTITHVVTGVIVAILTTRLFYLPPVELPARFNVFHFLYLLGWFIVSMIHGSLHVAWVAVRPKPVNPGSVIAVELHTRSDLLTTLVGQISGLIPGTFVTEIDRAHSVLYLHVLNCNTPETIEANLQQTRKIEILLIKAMGSPHDIEVMNDYLVSEGKEPILKSWSLSNRRRRS